MNDSFDLGGTGGNAFSFGAVGAQPGAFVVGKVLAMAEVQARHFDGPLKGQPATWDNGDPKMQYRITLQTDLRDPANAHDDGKRDVYIDGRRTPFDNGGKSKICAVLDAVRSVTGGTALAPGAFLRLQWVSGMGFAGDPRCYEASYQAPQIELGGPAAAPAQSTAPTSSPPPGWVAAPSVQAAQQVTQAAQGPTFANRQTGEIATPEQVAAVKAAGLDPAVVFANA